jgi:hypothetical protein
VSVRSGAIRLWGLLALDERVASVCLMLGVSLFLLAAVVGIFTMPSLVFLWLMLPGTALFALSAIYLMGNILYLALKNP